MKSWSAEMTSHHSLVRPLLRVVLQPTALSIMQVPYLVKKYIVQMESGAMIHTPSALKGGSVIQNLTA